MDLGVWFGGGWRACLLEWVSEKKSETELLLQNQRTQEIFLKRKYNL